MRPKIRAAELFCLCINRDIAFVVANGEDLLMNDGAEALVFDSLFCMGKQRPRGNSLPEVAPPPGQEL